MSETATPKPPVRGLDERGPRSPARAIDDRDHLRRGNGGDRCRVSDYGPPRSTGWPPRRLWRRVSALPCSAVFIAWRVLAADEPRPSPRIDVPGAILLGIGTLGILLAAAQPSVWDTPWVGAAIHVVAALALGAWMWLELRTPVPLVDLRLLVAGGILRANAAMLSAGIGMYLLSPRLTRYVQTPDAGYGRGLSRVLAGAALIPFLALDFIAGRLTGWLTNHVSARWTFVIYAAYVTLAAALFAVVPGSLITTLGSMAILGFGVGGASAIMPRRVLDGVPGQETSSVLSINQIVRTVGFSIGSALVGLLLATTTPAGDPPPQEHRYTIAAIDVAPVTRDQLGGRPNRQSPGNALTSQADRAHALGAVNSLMASNI